MKQTIELLRLCNVVIENKIIHFISDGRNVARIKYHISSDYNFYIDRVFLFNQYIDHTEDLVEFISEIYQNYAEDS